METDPDDVLGRRVAPVPEPLRGDEAFTGASGPTDPFTVLDFWRYAMPDLRTNTTRGLLAEFLAHRALGARVRNGEWESFDVLTDDGLRVEVKASAYVQVWDQRGPSAIRFTRLRGRTGTARGGDGSEPTYNADVYVFALHTAPDHAAYDPLDLGQWSFYVLPGPRVEALAQTSLGLATLSRLAGPSVPFDALAARVRSADPRRSAGAAPGSVPAARVAASGPAPWRAASAAPADHIGEG
ncbi:hypothetical protein ABZZ17_03605 [Streptomyces sp. NPDC006512]|uniref:hypothetical protein n=1 Tax=Streptomyces sp. NPDC006512 TaxID=3154307 RepID=UPI0033BEDC24